MKAKDIETIRKSVALLQSAGSGEIPADIVGLFAPPKRVQDLSDEEVEALVGSKVLRNLLGLDEPHHLTVLRTVLNETREAPIERSITQAIDALFETLPSNLLELTITPPTIKDGGVVAQAVEGVIRAMRAANLLGSDIPSVTVFRKGVAFTRYRRARSDIGGRFKLADYATFIGRTFTKTTTQMVNPDRNGTFELRILPGDPNNVACHEVSVELHQRPSNGKHLPIIKFPPSKGDRADHRRGVNLVSDGNVVEVASMSGMMKASILATPQTPAVFFGLYEEFVEQKQKQDPWA